MNRSNSVWLLALTLVAASVLPPAIMAQDPEAPTNAVTNVEASESDTNTVASTEPASNDKIHHRGPIVVWGHDVELKKGEEAETVVVIGGNAKVYGKVNGAVVTIFGSQEVSSEVHDAAVAIMGNVKLHTGAEIHDAVVAVLGDVDAEKDTTIGDAVIAVGGHVDAQDGASIGGKVESLDLPRSIKTWFVQCVLKLRPLAPQVGWVWIIAGTFLLLYLFVTVLFPRPVQACVNELSNRPATTFFLGLLTKILMPILISLLALTVAGLVVVPFLMAALMLGAIVGKAALLQSVGSRFARLSSGPTLQKPVMALLIGALFITVLYMVPVLGLLTFMFVSIWGLGGAVTAAAVGLRREVPQRPSPPPQYPNIPSPAPAPMNDSLPDATSFPPQQTIPPALPEVLSFPRARLLERLAAGLLDVVLLCIICKMCHVDGFWPLVVLAYFTAMWTWKSTTVGGIILGLKVVRLDGLPIPFTVALVRALGAAFSVIVLFLGFLWIAWDREKQGWHDQIAGTVVIRLPRGTPLVCF